jgi:large subunit ribosomal protein L24
MTQKLHIRSGDTVEVIAGNSKGMQGRVLRALPRENRVVVEGVNIVVKHMKPRRGNQQGGRIEMEAPIDASNCLVLCPNRECDRHDRGVRTRTRVDDDGTRQRVCARCGTDIPREET